MFSERLKKLREEKNLTQKDLASILEITGQAISNYENGREPSYDILVRIADYFEVTTDYLTGKSLFKTVEEEFELKQNNLLDNLDNADPDVVIILHDMLLSFRGLLYDSNLLNSNNIEVLKLLKRLYDGIHLLSTKFFFLIDLESQNKITLSSAEDCKELVQETYKSYVNIRNEIIDTIDLFYLLYLKKGFIAKANENADTQ